MLHLAKCRQKALQNRHIHYRITKEKKKKNSLFAKTVWFEGSGHCCLQAIFPCALGQDCGVSHTYIQDVVKWYHNKVDLMVNPLKRWRRRGSNPSNMTTNFIWVANNNKQSLLCCNGFYLWCQMMSTLSISKPMLAATLIHATHISNHSQLCNPIYNLFLSCIISY